MISKIVLHHTGECDIVTDRIFIKVFDFDATLLNGSNYDEFAECTYNAIYDMIKDKKRCVELIVNDIINGKTVISK